MDIIDEIKKLEGRPALKIKGFMILEDEVFLLVSELNAANLSLDGKIIEGKRVRVKRIRI